MRQKLLSLLTAAVLLTLAVLPARAVRVVPVTVDGALLSGVSYLESGTTFVPLRALCDALGGWTVSWDAQSHCARAVCSGVSVAAKPGQTQLTVNGAAVAAAGPVCLKNGCTYIPLRTLCRALGYSVCWDGVLDGAAVATGRANPAFDEDLYWLSRIISAESQGESLEGQIAVGNVVLNRVAAAEFPDTVREVVFDRKDGVQFEPVSLGTVCDEPTALSVTAARAALNGASVVGACLYFYAPALSQGTWIRENRTYCKTIGCHRFYL